MASCEMAQSCLPNTLVRRFFMGEKNSKKDKNKAEKQKQQQAEKKKQQQQNKLPAKKPA